MIDFLPRPIDTDPHPLFPVYSAGNFAEVSPPRWSPVSWSLIGDPVERALRGLVQRVWPRARWQTGSRYVFVGYFACRPYHNLSAFAHITAHVPRLQASALTEGYFEGVPAPPPTARVHVGAAARVAGVARGLREIYQLQRRLSVLDARTHETESLARTATAYESAMAVGTAVTKAHSLLDEVWSAHYDTTALIVALQALQRAVGRRTLPWWDEIEGWINRPGALPWMPLHDAAEAAVPHGQVLKFPFYEVADHIEPWAGLARGVAGEPPKDRVADEHDPIDVLWPMSPIARYTGLPNIVALVEDLMRRRETSKSLAMRTLHTIRTLLPALARGAAVSEELWPYLTIRELLDPRSRGVLEPRARERRELCVAAIAEPMPDQLIFPSIQGTHPPTPPVVPSRGRGVSPGVVTGLVVSREIEETDCEEPRILVCERADVDVQHLLTNVDGLLTERGSALSHIAVIVREFGIPAVVGSPLANGLRAGQRVTIDGTNGEVVLL